MKQRNNTKINDLQDCFGTPHTGVNKISSFMAIGRNQNLDTEKSVMSVGYRVARFCVATTNVYDRNSREIGTSFNSASSASLQTGSAKEGAINVEEIIKSAMADYMECGDDDAVDQFYLAASATKSITNSDNKLGSKDGTKDKEIDVEAIAKSTVEAFMECDEVDEDFVTTFASKSETKSGKDLVVYANEQVVDANGKIDDADKLDEFASNIDKEVSEIPHLKWGDIDMVFFAFCISKRYYTMCFYFHRKALVIIDVSKDGEDHDLRFTYGSIPKTLRTFFCKYLTMIGCHNQCKTVINVPIQRLKMRWRTTNKVDDNGVYLLRHLEVYMGEREGQWNCGLSTENKGVLQYLRAKYNRVLMVARNNHSGLLNKEAASKHYAKESKKIKIT
ncbi:hypothetical protein SASPL_138072 [Salvia splendens]|uniref:Uncharacterized protein n=1 Tax=Salvia splendens TaxID=180675 RepID=A0A8X8WW75_SALSN|nr:hypothetical protein SASPL_138072 [Salvia splendens]